MDFNPNFKGADKVLNEHKDEYAMVECAKKKKYMTLSLSEDARVDRIVVSNQERFSSTFKNVQVLGSSIFPTNERVALGDVVLQPTREDQTFKLQRPSWVRYIKLRFRSHYGNEYYCTLTNIRIYGKTIYDSLQNTLDEAQGSAELSIESVDDGDAGDLHSGAEPSSKAAVTPEDNTTAENTILNPEQGIEDGNTTPQNGDGEDEQSSQDLEEKVPHNTSIAGAPEVEVTADQLPDSTPAGKAGDAQPLVDATATPTSDDGSARESGLQEPSVAQAKSDTIDSEESVVPASVAADSCQATMPGKGSAGTVCQATGRQAVDDVKAAEKNSTAAPPAAVQVDVGEDGSEQTQGASAAPVVESPGLSADSTQPVPTLLESLVAPKPQASDASNGSLRASNASSGLVASNSNGTDGATESGSARLAGEATEAEIPQGAEDVVMEPPAVKLAGTGSQTTHEVTSTQTSNEADHASTTEPDTVAANEHSGKYFDDSDPQRRIAAKEGMPKQLDNVARLVAGKSVKDEKDVHLVRHRKDPQPENQTELLLQQANQEVDELHRQVETRGEKLQEQRVSQQAEEQARLNLESHIEVPEEKRQSVEGEQRNSQAQEHQQPQEQKEEADQQQLQPRQEQQEAPQQQQQQVQAEQQHTESQESQTNAKGTRKRGPEAARPEQASAPPAHAPPSAPHDSTPASMVVEVNTSHSDNTTTSTTPSIADRVRPETSAQLASGARDVGAGQTSAGSNNSIPLATSVVVTDRIENLTLSLATQLPKQSRKAYTDKSGGGAGLNGGAAAKRIENVFSTLNMRLLYLEKEEVSMRKYISNATLAYNKDLKLLETHANDVRSKLHQLRASLDTASITLRDEFRHSNRQLRQAVEQVDAGQKHTTEALSERVAEMAAINEIMMARLRVAEQLIWGMQVLIAAAALGFARWYFAKSGNGAFIGKDLTPEPASPTSAPTTTQKRTRSKPLKKSARSKSRPRRANRLS